MRKSRSRPPSSGLPPASIPLRIAIVGRPHVGKSTFFNRLAGKRLAIVHDRPGVTRDWQETSFHIPGCPPEIAPILIDTAGLEKKFETTLDKAMYDGTASMLRDVDIILLIIDGRDGVTPVDEHFATWLRRNYNCTMHLMVNKSDLSGAKTGLMEAYSLGFGEPIPLSAEHGIGVSDLQQILLEHAIQKALEAEKMAVFEAAAAIAAQIQPSDAVVPALPESEAVINLDEAIIQDEKLDPNRPIKVAIVGRPNVGKSTLVNALLGQSRMLTGAEPGVTRDAVTVAWKWNDQVFELVDTAGMRRRAKIDDAVEKMMVGSSLYTLRMAQVVILVLDYAQALEKQDLTLARTVVEEGRVLILAMNKWDTKPRMDGKAEKLYWEGLRADLDHVLSQVHGVPVIATSALRGKGLDELMHAVMDQYSRWNKRVGTGRLNRWLIERTEAHPTPLIGGRPNKLRYMTQAKARPPTFAIWASRPDELPESYLGYLRNCMAKDFDMHGVPIRINLRKSDNPFARDER